MRRGSSLSLIRSLFSLFQAHKIIHTAPLFYPSWRLHPTHCLPINSGKVSCRSLCVGVCLFVAARSYVHTASFTPPSPNANQPAQHPRNDIKVFRSLVLRRRCTVPIFAWLPSMCVYQVVVPTRGVPFISIFFYLLSQLNPPSQRTHSNSLKNGGSCKTFKHTY